MVTENQLVKVGVDRQVGSSPRRVLQSQGNPSQSPSQTIGPAKGFFVSQGDCEAGLRPAFTQFGRRRAPCPTLASACDVVQTSRMAEELSPLTCPRERGTWHWASISSPFNPSPFRPAIRHCSPLPTLRPPHRLVNQLWESFQLPQVGYQAGMGEDSHPLDVVVELLGGQRADYERA